MTIQGQNLILEVYNIFEGEDDYVGGVQPTGTYVGNVYARLDRVPGADLVLMQGLEVPKIFQAEITNVNPAVWVNIEEHDQIKLISPVNHFLFGHRLRVRHIRESSMLRDDPRHFRAALLSRLDTSHRNME